MMERILLFSSGGLKYQLLVKTVQYSTVQYSTVQQTLHMMDYINICVQRSEQLASNSVNMHRI